MPVIYLETVMNALPQTVFDLSRSVDLHQSSMLHHNEKVVAGVKNGLMNKGDTVTWQAKHLFKNRLLKVHITAMNPPHSFTDEIIEGDFKKMKHQHQFKALDNGTLMIDRFEFESPFRILGWLANKLFLKAYMTKLLAERNKEIKLVAESDQWKHFLNK